MYDDILKYLNENSNIKFEFSSMFGRFLSKGMSIDMPTAKNMFANGATLQVKNGKASAVPYVHITSCALDGMACIDLCSNNSTLTTIELLNCIMEDSELKINMAQHVIVKRLKIVNTHASFNFIDSHFSSYHTLDFQDSFVDCSDEVFIGTINFKDKVCPVISYSDNDFEIIYNARRYFNTHTNDLFRDLKSSNLI